MAAVVGRSTGSLAVPRQMHRLVIAFLVLVIAAPLAFAEGLAELCPLDEDFLCLVRHTSPKNVESNDHWWMENNDRWWKMYRLRCRKAWQCASARDVATYLTIWSADGLDGDLSEGITEDTENLLIWKPTCFFEGALALAPELQNRLEERFDPMFRPTLVMKTLNEYQGHARYRGIAARLAQPTQRALEGASEADEPYPTGFAACR
jgi:hypothetical protein